MGKKFDLSEKTIILTGSAGRVGSRFSEILVVLFLDRIIEINSYTIHSKCPVQYF